MMKAARLVWPGAGGGGGRGLLVVMVVSVMVKVQHSSAQICLERSLHSSTFVKYMLLAIGSLYDYAMNH